MARQGLNATLSYRRGSRTHAYRLRVNLLAHGMKIVFDESQARVRKAFYPHRLSSAQFVVGVQLVGEDEYRSFSGWLASYAQYALDPDLAFGEFPSMAVSVPSYGFLRKGVPLTGFEWGDRVGAMLWQPQIVFETSEEPVDAHQSVALSRFVAGLTRADRDARFFYPSSTQLSGSKAPPDGTYTQVLTAEQLLAAVNTSHVGGDSGSANAAEYGG